MNDRPVELSPSAMRAAYQRHAVAEYGCDLEGTLATMTIDAVEDFHPLGLQVRGRQAIREQYRRLMADFIPSTLGEGSVALSDAFGDRHVVLERQVSVKAVDGDVQTHRACAVFAFAQDGRIEIERLYADAGLGARIQHSLGNGLLDVPGVQPILGRQRPTLVSRADRGDGRRAELLDGYLARIGADRDRRTVGLHPDVTATIYPDGQVARGRDAVVELLDGLVFDAFAESTIVGTAFGETHIAVEHEFAAAIDGVADFRHAIDVVAFDAGLMTQRRIYMDARVGDVVDLSGDRTGAR